MELEAFRAKKVLLLILVTTNLVTTKGKKFCGFLIWRFKKIEYIGFNFVITVVFTVYSPLIPSLNKYKIETQKFVPRNQTDLLKTRKFIFTKLFVFWTPSIPTITSAKICARKVRKTERPLPI